MGVLKSIDPGFKKASEAIVAQIERRGLETSRNWEDGILMIRAMRRGECAFRVALKPHEGGLDAAVAEPSTTKLKFRHSQRYDIRGSHQSLTTALDGELDRHPAPLDHDLLEDVYDAEEMARKLTDFLVGRFGSDGAREVLEAARMTLDEVSPPEGP